MVMLDSTIIRAHPCVAGATASQDGQGAQSLGRNRGGFSTKIHMVVDALDNPLDFNLMGNQRHDAAQAPALLQEWQRDYVIADKTYDANALLELMEAIGTIPVLPARFLCAGTRYYDQHLYYEWHLIECFITRLSDFARSLRGLIKWRAVIWIF